MPTPQQQLICTLDLMLAGALISSPSITPSSMSVANLLDYRPQKICSFIDLAHSTEFTLDLTTPLSLSSYTGISTYRYIQLIGSNISSAGTVEAFIGSSPSAVSSAITSDYHVATRLYWLTIEPNLFRFPRRHTWIDLGQQWSSPYIRVVLSDSLNTAGHLDVGTAIVHPGYVPAMPILKQPVAVPTTLAGEVVSQSGSRQTRVQPVFRTMEFILQAQASQGISARQEVIANWLQLQELQGQHNPISVVTNLTPINNYMDDIIYGTIEQLGKVELPESWGRTEVTWQVKELR